MLKANAGTTAKNYGIISGAVLSLAGGFLMAGIGILAGVLTIYICKWCANGIGRLVNRFVRKKVRKDE